MHTPRTDTAAVSPVVGVILMVAVTVILSATVGIFVFNLGGTVNESPQAGITVDKSGDTVSVQVVTTENAERVIVQSGQGSFATLYNLTSAGDTVDLPKRNQRVTVYAETDGHRTALRTFTIYNASRSSCQAILDANSSATDGAYRINPSGDAVYSTYCDMSTDGGGWTLIGKVSGDPVMYDGWLKSSHNEALLTDLDPVPQDSYASLDARYLAGEQAATIRFSSTDISKWVKAPIHSDATQQTIFNVSAGQSTINQSAHNNPETITATAWNGSTSQCYTNKYMVMPLGGHGGSYPAWTYNIDGNTATGDYCMGVGVNSGTDHNGFVFGNNNGYDTPQSDSDWPNSQYNHLNTTVYVWVR